MMPLPGIYFRGQNTKLLKGELVSDIHITRELLRAVLAGEVPPRLLIEVGLKHLTAVCPFCREEYEAFVREPRTASGNYDAAFRVLPALMDRHRGEYAEADRMARRDLRALLKLPQLERLQKIAHAVSRFRGATLAALLLDESKACLPGDPRSAYELAEAAEAVLLRTPIDQAIGLMARSAAYFGNALRLLGKPDEAKERFRQARAFIRNGGATDPHILAEVDWLEGALHMDRRRFAQAEELLSRAVALYAVSGDREQSARPLLTLGSMYYYRGDYLEAIQTIRTALALLPQETDPRFYLYCRYNLAFFLAEAGEYQAAAEELAAHRHLYRDFPDEHTTLHRRWLEGRIAAGLGHLDEAEQAFLIVREGFIARGSGFDAAITSLELALLYIREGRTAAVRQLAEEMQPIFAAEDVHREAVAALLLFEEAARRDELTVESVEQLARYLKAARTDSTLRFKAS